MKVPCFRNVLDWWKCKTFGFKFPPGMYSSSFFFVLLYVSSFMLSKLLSISSKLVVVDVLWRTTSLMLHRGGTLGIGKKLCSILFLFVMNDKCLWKKNNKNMTRNKVAKTCKKYSIKVGWKAWTYMHICSKFSHMQYMLTLVIDWHKKGRKFKTTHQNLKFASKSMFIGKGINKDEILIILQLHPWETSTSMYAMRIHAFLASSYSHFFSTRSKTS